MPLTVLVSGLFRGFGIGAKMQVFNLVANGLIVTILSFAIEIELGRVLGLSLVLLVRKI